MEKLIKKIRVSCVVLLVISVFILLVFYLNGIHIETSITNKENKKLFIKPVAALNNMTTLENATNDIKYFYNTLDEASKYIMNTNKFNCSSSGCSSNTLFRNNIGFLTKYEYNLVGGNDSYLYNYTPFFILNNGVVENLNSSSTSSSLRGSVYLRNNIKVTGSGTIEDPYMFNKEADINLLGYTLYGSSTNYSFSWLLDNKAVNSVNCTKSNQASWNYETNSINIKGLLVPDNCIIDFNDGYTVTLNVDNGTVTSARSVVTKYNGIASFNITPLSGYKLEGSTVRCTGSATASITSTGIKVTNITSTQTCTVSMKANPKLYEIILADNPTVRTRTDFSTPFVQTNTNVIYQGSETVGSSTNNIYYFSGNATNNWVKFGKDESGNDIYWRIIRTNSNNSIRLLYSGTSPNSTSGYIENSKFNTNTSGDPMYVGYKYGTSGSLISNRTNTNNSAIKTYIDNWYKNNLLTNYDKYISKTAVYCNDRSIGSGTYTTGSSYFYYGAYTRISTNKTPSLNCADTSDMFTSNRANVGNKKLSYPIALMTADEIIFAGGSATSQLSSPYVWYYTNSNGESITGTIKWWTMTPYFWSGRLPQNYYVNGSQNVGKLNSDYPYESYGVRPVISLKMCVLWASGDGSSDSPYTVASNSDCDVALN